MAVSLSVVGGANAMFEYPIPTALRLSGHSWVAFDYVRWDRSTFRIRADLEVKGVFLDLLGASQKETPVGTLPVEEDLQADAANVTLDVWRRLMARPISPLYGWRQCLCDDGSIRLYHPVVLEVVQDALKYKLRNAQRAESDRERKRLEDLPAQVLRAGCSKAMSEDQGFILQLDQYLIEHLPMGRNRTALVVRRAIEQMQTGVENPVL